MGECLYRGKKILDTEHEAAFHCDGYMARSLEKKPCDTGEAHYDPLLGLCRIPKPALKRSGGPFARLGEGRFV